MADDTDLPWEDGLPAPTPVKLQEGPTLTPRILHYNHISSFAPAAPERHIWPFLRRGDMAVVVAPAFAGKTTLLADIALDYTEPGYTPGGCLGGSWRVNRELDPGGLCAILDADGWREDWAEPLAKTARTRGLNAAEAADAIEKRILHIRCEETDFYNDADQTIANIVHTCTQLGVGLLLMDPLAKLFGMEEVADVRWVFQRLAKLRDYLRPAGVTSVVTAHPAHKGGNSGNRYYMPSGSAAQDGVWDARFGLEKLSRKSKLYVYKCRATRWIDAGTYVELPHTGQGAGFGPALDTKDWAFDPPLVKLDKLSRKVLAACPAEAEFTMPLLYDTDNPRKIRKATVLEQFKQVLVPWELVKDTGGGGGKAITWVVTDKGRLALAGDQSRD